MATVPATEFNRNPSHIKRLAASAPVIITEHDRPALVLLAYAEYERLLGVPQDVSRWLEMDEDIEFDIEPVDLGISPLTDL